LLPRGYAPSRCHHLEPDMQPLVISPIQDKITMPLAAARCGFLVEGAATAGLLDVALFARAAALSAERLQ
jgi:hypothetical protein